MHSSNELTRESFKVEAAGHPVRSLADLIPNFGSQDRLGVVVRESLGGVRVSGFLSALITAFYDEHRKTGTEFFIYPDYFVFHAGCPPGDYTMLDIWPSHKSLAVDDVAEEILRAVNDRGITVLLLVDASRRDRPLERQTRNSALSRLKQAFLRTQEDNAVIRVQSDTTVEQYVEDAIVRTPGLSGEQRAAIRARRNQDRVAGHVVERYRTIPVPDSLAYL